jgi:cytoskeleton protein RodZ
LNSPLIFSLFFNFLIFYCISLSFTTTHCKPYLIITMSNAETSAPTSTVNDLPSTADAIEQLHLPDIPPPPESSALKSLRAIREAQGRSVEDVASALRLSQAQINALEENRWQALPGAAYVKGFLRNYARHLGVEPQPYIDEYTVQTHPQAIASGNANKVNYVNSATDKSLKAPHPTSNASLVRDVDSVKNDPAALTTFNPSGEEKTSGKRLAGVVASLIAATLAFLIYWERGLWLPTVEQHFKTFSTWFGGAINQAPANVPAASAPAKTTDAPPPVDNKTSVNPSESNTSGASNNATTSVTAPDTSAGSIRSLELQLDKSVWVEIRDADNNVLTSGTKPKSTQFVKGKAPLSITIGAADAVNLKVDGKVFNVIDEAQANVAKFSIP